MNTKMIGAIQLDDFQNISELKAKLLAAANEDGMYVLLVDGKVVGSVVSPHATKELICRDVVDRWTEHPEIIDELQRRIEQEAPEDWE